MIKFCLSKYNELVAQLTQQQFISITVNLYLQNKNTFKNFVVEANKIISDKKIIKPIKQNDNNLEQQIQLRKELYVKAKNIKNDEIRKKIYKELRQIQQQLNNNINCFNSLNEIKQTISKEVQNDN